MKRVMFAAMLLVSTVTVFATETKGKEDKVQTKEVRSTPQQFDECEVSISSKVGPSFAQVEVKCTYRAATCKEAISNVAQCLKDAKAAVMQ
jgi:methionine-rich copper-binding protein CopC